MNQSLLLFNFCIQLCLGILYDDLTDEIFAEYNGDGSVVVFSFMVGFNDDPELKSVACNNGGYFYRIQTVGKYD